MRILAALTVALLLGAPAFGAENSQFMHRFAQNWSARCSFPSGPLTFEFKSKGGDPTEDDMSVQVVQRSGTKVTWGLRDQLYVADKFAGPAKSLCDRIPAYLIGKDTVLVVLIYDMRPLEDRAKALLVSGDGTKIIAGPTELGATVDTPSIKVIEGGIAIHLMRDSKSESDPIRMSWVTVRPAGAVIDVAWGK